MSATGELKNHQKNVPEMDNQVNSPKADAVMATQASTIKGRQSAIVKSRFGRQIKSGNGVQPAKQEELKASGRRKGQGKHKPMNTKTNGSEESSTSPKGVNLAKRKDVINKTLLRSIKRYYT
mmetsp:Transcript_33818/g.39001  ORF Transcript_33818/g.39001 Transcript_33818/m.39001 type:complete len:122 (+) Transcript_33818:367-732(+)